MKAIAIAIEVEVPDDFDALKVQGLKMPFVPVGRPGDAEPMTVLTMNYWQEIKVVRIDVHPDPDVIFPPADE